VLLTFFVFCVVIFGWLSETKKVNNTQPTKNHNTERKKSEQQSTNQNHNTES
jgi:hypothetical protein